MILSMRTGDTSLSALESPPTAPTHTHGIRGVALRGVRAWASLGQLWPEREVPEPPGQAPMSPHCLYILPHTQARLIPLGEDQHSLAIQLLHQPERQGGSQVLAIPLSAQPAAPKRQVWCRWGGSIGPSLRASILNQAFTSPFGP